MSQAEHSFFEGFVSGLICFGCTTHAEVLVQRIPDALPWVSLLLPNCSSLLWAYKCMSCRLRLLPPTFGSTSPSHNLLAAFRSFAATHAPEISERLRPTLLEQTQAALKFAEVSCRFWPRSVHNSYCNCQRLSCWSNMDCNASMRQCRLVSQQLQGTARASPV